MASLVTVGKVWSTLKDENGWISGGSTGAWHPPPPPILVILCLGDLSNKLLWLEICRFLCVPTVNIHRAWSVRFKSQHGCPSSQTFSFPWDSTHLQISAVLQLVLHDTMTESSLSHSSTYHRDLIGEHSRSHIQSRPISNSRTECGSGLITWYGTVHLTWRYSHTRSTLHLTSFHGRWCSLVRTYDSREMTNYTGIG